MWVHFTKTTVLMFLLTLISYVSAKSVEELKEENDRLKVLMESLLKSIKPIEGTESGVKSAALTTALTSTVTSTEPTLPVENKPHPVIASHGFSDSVKVFHMQTHHWGKSHEGLEPCDTVRCEWTNSFNVKGLKEQLDSTDINAHESLKTTTVSLYNIHYLWEKRRETKPPICELKTDLTMAETEESRVRYGQLFEGFKNFDGHSGTQPSADLPRIYEAAFLNKTDPLMPLVPFPDLIKAGSYVASDCHKRDSANANRDSVVYKIRMEDFRIDGLGKCMRTPTGPEGISLPKTRDTSYNIFLKKQVIGKYLFNFAFENSIERGYVTEKPFNALESGTVPVYLGDSLQLKSLLPHPKAAIFVADYGDNYTALADYLKYLSTNESAYEEHRAWRKTFTYHGNFAHKPLMQQSWYCGVCKWAVQAADKPHKRTTHCGSDSPVEKEPDPPATATVPVVASVTTDTAPAQSAQSAATTTATPATTASALPRYTLKSKPIITPAVQIKAPAGWERKGVRAENSRQIYYVKNGILHAVPDYPTFKSLMLVAEQIIVLGDLELENYITGDSVEKVNPTEEALYSKKSNPGFKRFEYT